MSKLNKNYRINRKSKEEVCSECGNHTLEKVSVNVDADGNVRYGRFRRNLNLRGTIVRKSEKLSIQYLNQKEEKKESI